MPQMKPLLWLNLYIYFLLLFIIFFVMFNYLFIYKKIDSVKESKIVNVKKNLKWLW